MIAAGPTSHTFHNRRDVVEHMQAAHDWQDDGAYDGQPSPDPLGWHAHAGGYLVSTGELLTIHRELHHFSSEDVR